jgi:hypothetical protein
MASDESSKAAGRPEMKTQGLVQSSAWQILLRPCSRKLTTPRRLTNGAHYLGSATGLLVSHDKGATWQPQGAPVNVWQGPFFGQNAKEMVVIGSDGLFRTKDSRATWTRLADLKAKESGFAFSPNWFGCYAWDPVNHILYASAMGNPVYRLDF